MEQLYQIETVITPSLCDAEGLLDWGRAFGLFMDLASLHSEELGTGVRAMLERDLFWLAARSRARFRRRPRVGERVTLQTWPDRPGKVRVLRSYRILQGEEELAAAKTDWAVLRVSTQSLAQLTGVFPPQLEFDLPPACPEPFARLRREFGPEDVCGEYRVRSTDIDLGGHVNNAAYLPVLLGSFSTQQRREHAFREIDLVYKAPCFEGDLLRLARRPAEGGGWDLALLRDDKPAFLARLA